jgi:hypothetical protein
LHKELRCNQNNRIQKVSSDEVYKTHINRQLSICFQLKIDIHLWLAFDACGASNDHLNLMTAQDLKNPLGPQVKSF